MRGESPADPNDPPSGHRRESDEQEQPPQVSLGQAMEPRDDLRREHDTTDCERTAEEVDDEPTVSPTAFAPEQREPHEVHGGRRHDRQHSRP